MGAAEAVAAAMPELQSWIGRARVVEEEIALSAVRRIAGTFDMDPDAFAKGSALPPHWFNLFFSDVARQSAIGPDGHPRKGEFLPPIPLPRRMGAGRRVRIHGRLRVGDAAAKRVEVAAITPKTARTGQIVVLTMRHTITARGETIAVEEFDAIYREEVPKGTATAATTPPRAPEDHAWEDRVPLDPVQVFRYGAITWNAHRIHYDADYARGTEGYPGVVMNGGLTMHLLVESALRRAPSPLRGFTTRLVSPLFVGDHVALRGAPDGAGIRAWAANGDGALAAEMSLEFGT
jgi:3-methylfumaryl-CoA hydratase